MNPYDPYSIPDPDGGIDLFHITHLLTLGAIWVVGAFVIVTLALVVWRLQSPATYQRHIAAPARRTWRVVCTTASWSRIEGLRFVDFRACHTYGLAGQNHDEDSLESSSPSRREHVRPLSAHDRPHTDRADGGRPRKGGSRNP